MREITRLNAVLHVALFEDSVKAGASPWIKVPPQCTHWSFAIATKHNLEEGGRILIEVSNDESEPKEDSPGSVVVALQPDQEAAYIQASYRFMRAVRIVGAKPAPVTAYGVFNFPS